jgi:hypothetical protein
MMKQLKDTQTRTHNENNGNESVKTMRLTLSDEETRRQGDVGLKIRSE